MKPESPEVLNAQVSEVGQWLATGLTFALALAAICFVARICIREKIIWPAILTVSGGLAALMEPLFEHLYGLVFPRGGQWHLYTTFGSAQPVWVPAAYVAFYGGASVIIARNQRGANRGRTPGKQNRGRTPEHDPRRPHRLVAHEVGAARPARLDRARRDAERRDRNARTARVAERAAAGARDRRQRVG